MNKNYYFEANGKDYCLSVSKDDIESIINSEIYC